MRNVIAGQYEYLELEVHTYLYANTVSKPSEECIALYIGVAGFELMSWLFWESRLHKRWKSHSDR